MTLTRKLASALCLAFLFITLSSKSQTVDPTTGELINFSGTPTSTTSNWNNAGSVGQPLTCWAPGGQGYCGPNPRVSAWGPGSNIINYSYGLTDLNQIVNVNKAIAAANGNTTGINVTGFKFSFTAKNGNGWDNGQQDQLNAYVKFYDSTNTKVLENYNYDLNRKYNWTNFSYNETFTTPRAVTTLGNAQVGFVGKDTNYWVGPYGPEIMNVSFSLKYAVDPCANNYVYNPQCPNSSLPVAIVAAAPPPIAAAPPPITSTGVVDVGGVQLSTSGTINIAGTAPTPVAEPLPTAAAPLLGVPPGVAPVTAGANNTPNILVANAAGPAQQQGGGKSTSGPSSLAMSVVSRVQAADRATQAMAVQNAQQVVATSSAKAQDEANKVVDQANALSAESSQASQTLTSSSTQSTSNQQANAGSAGGLQGPSVMSVQALTASATQSMSAGVPQFVAQTSSTQFNDSSEMQSPNTQGLPLQMPQLVQQEQSMTQQSSSTYTPPTVAQTTEAPVVQSKSSQGLLLQPPQIVEQAQVIMPMQSTYQAPVASNETSIYSLASNTAIRPNQGITLNSQAPVVVAMVTPQLVQQKQEFKFETRIEQEQPQIYQPQQTALTRGSVINDILEQRLNIGSMQMEQQMDTVKKNVLPNELAGSVDIANIAMIPKGYEAYSIVTLRDSPFYKAEPIYKDQKTIDNARVFRGLTGGSDAKHQEMVNQQYKLGE